MRNARLGYVGWGKNEEDVFHFYYEGYRVCDFRVKSHRGLSLHENPKMSECCVTCLRKYSKDFFDFDNKENSPEIRLKQKMKSIVVNERTKNTLCHRFYIDEPHTELKDIISEACAKNGVDFNLICKKKVISLDKYGWYWLEEHMAAICNALWRHLPIPDRVEWLSFFLGRNRLQIKNLIGIHFGSMSSKEKGLDSYYELYLFEYRDPIEEYFIKFYPPPTHYIYKDKKVSRKEG